MATVKKSEDNSKYAVSDILSYLKIKPGILYQNSNNYFTLNSLVTVFVQNKKKISPYIPMPGISNDPFSIRLPNITSTPVETARSNRVNSPELERLRQAERNLLDEMDRTVSSETRARIERMSSADIIQRDNLSRIITSNQTTVRMLRQSLDTIRFEIAAEEHRIRLQTPQSPLTTSSGTIVNFGTTGATTSTRGQQRSRRIQQLQDRIASSQRSINNDRARLSLNLNAIQRNSTMHLIEIRERSIRSDNAELERLIEEDRSTVPNEAFPVEEIQDRMNELEAEDWLSEEISKVASEEESKLSPFLQNRLDQYNNFKLSYGGVVGLIKGYIINDEVYTDSEKIYQVLANADKNTIKSVKIIIRTYDLKEDGSIRKKIVVVDKNGFSIISKYTSSLACLFSILFKLKITGYEPSGNVFGSPTHKKGLVGEYPAEWELESGNYKKLGRTSFYISVIDTDKHKFLLNDCELINPDLGTYNIPKDITITIGSIVELNNKKLARYKAEKDKKGEVVSIKSNPSSKRIGKNSRNRRLDLVTIKLISGKITTLYAQDLKLIEKKKYVNAIKEKEGYNYTTVTLNSVRDFFEEELRGGRRRGSGLSGTI